MSIIELPTEMAAGFRFYPTDEELIKDYLKPKLLGEDSKVDHIVAEVDFCNIEPWNLPLESKIKSKDRMWLFFCVQRLTLVKKSSKKKAETESVDMIWKITGKKKTGTGSWKITGEEKEIKDQNTGECIGKKRNLVFDKTHNKNKKWVMQEFYIIPGNPLPNQNIYVLRRLKEKPNNKVKTPDGGEGEPSGDIRSEVENSATPAAVSSAHGNEEVDQELLPQPLNSPVCELTDDEISLLSSVGFFRGHNETQALCGAGEREELPQEFMDSPAGGDTNAEGVDVESPHAICHLEKKTDERAGGLGCHEGEPGGDIIDDMNNPVARAVISEEHGREEVNAALLSQPLLSPDYCLTEEDMRLLFLGCPNDGQQFNSGMHKYNPESENYVPHKGPYAISGSENITDEVTGNPGCDIVGKPSGYTTSGIGYQVAPAATLEVHANTEVNGEYLSPDYYLTEEDICSIFAGSSSDGYNNSQAPCGADEPEESPAEFLEGLKVKPDENFCGNTTSTLFNYSIQPKSLKRSRPLDAPAHVDTDVGGVDGRVKRPRSLALGESLQ